MMVCARFGNDSALSAFEHTVGLKIVKTDHWFGSKRPMAINDSNAKLTIRSMACIVNPFSGTVAHALNEPETIENK